jgi:hypothetical protein
VGLVVAGDDRAAEAAARAVRMATALANPSLIAYARTVEAQAALLQQNPDAAAVALASGAAAAQLVRNGWITTLFVNVLEGELHRAASEWDEALRVHLRVADEAHRSGWTIHAWVPMWVAAACLHALGREAEAALFTGACQASGNIRFPSVAFPPELEALIAGHGSPERLSQNELGTHLGLPELVRIATGQQPFPRTGRTPTRSSTSA